MGKSSKPTLTDYVDKETFCALLGIVGRTADRWALERFGPTRYRAGKKILYNRASISSWIESQAVFTDDARPKPPSSAERSQRYRDAANTMWVRRRGGLPKKPKRELLSPTERSRINREIANKSWSRRRAEDATKTPEPEWKPEPEPEPKPQPVVAEPRA